MLKTRLPSDFHPIQIRFLQNKFLIFHTENSSWPQTSPKNLLDSLTQDPRAWWRLNYRSVLSWAHRNGNLNTVCSESHSFARTVYGENNSKRQNSESKGGWERERPSSFIRSVGVKSTVNNTVWFMASAPLYESPYCDWDSFWPLSCVFFPGFSSHGLWPPPQLYSLPISVQKGQVWKQWCECALISCYIGMCVGLTKPQPICTFRNVLFCYPDAVICFLVRIASHNL